MVKDGLLCLSLTLSRAQTGEGNLIPYSLPYIAVLLEVWFTFRGGLPEKQAREHSELSGGRMNVHLASVVHFI